MEADDDDGRGAAAALAASLRDEDDEAVPSRTSTDEEETKLARESATALLYRGVGVGTNIRGTTRYGILRECHDSENGAEEEPPLTTPSLASLSDALFRDPPPVAPASSASDAAPSGGGGGSASSTAGSAMGVSIIASVTGGAASSVDGGGGRGGGGSGRRPRSSSSDAASGASSLPRSPGGSPLSRWGRQLSAGGRHTRSLLNHHHHGRPRSNSSGQPRRVPSRGNGGADESDEEALPIGGPGSAQSLAAAVERLENRSDRIGPGGGLVLNGALPGAAGAGAAGGPSSSGAESNRVIDDLERDVISRLTEIVLDAPGSGAASASPPSSSPPPPKYPTTESSFAAVTTLGRSIPRRVCQHPFRRNDIVWVCRTCQSDETCVLCHSCYVNSDHDGHDVAFYHAQAGGCCDCGDPDAWDPRGFCGRHGPGVDGGLGLGGGYAERAAGVVAASADWLVDVIGGGVEGGYNRANADGEGSRRSIEEGDKAFYRRLSSMPVDATDVLGRAGGNGDGHGDGSDDMAMEGDENGDGNGDGRNRRHSLDNSSVGMAQAAQNAASEGVLQRAMTAAMALDRRSSASIAASSSSSSSSSSSDSEEEMPDLDVEAPITITSPATDDTSLPPDAAAAPRIPPHATQMPLPDTPQNDPATMRTTGNIFVPSIASRSKSRSSSSSESAPSAVLTTNNGAPSIAERIGLLGSRGKGLYLVLHADDVHTTSETISALRELYVPPGSASLAYSLSPTHTEAILGKIVRLLRHHGDLILWGTIELAASLGPALTACWKDGDLVASSQFGAAMLAKASVLTSHGLVCSIKTRTELKMEQRAVGVIDWLSVVARSCDPLCRTVGGSIAHKHLVPLLHSDLKLPARITASWHALLLTLLAIPSFKANLANAYCDTYNAVTAEYAGKGVGILDRSSYTLSVQFLNRVAYVHDLVRERDLLGRLGRCLLETLSVAALPSGDATAAHGRRRARRAEDDDFPNPWGPPPPQTGFRARNRMLRTLARGARGWGRNARGGAEPAPSENRTTSVVPTLDPLHPILTHRRYSPCISDLKCVLNVKGTARLFASLPSPAANSNSSCCLNSWIECLSLAQNMDGQTWRPWSRGHVEVEPRGWVGAFNASISLGSLFERLLSWDDEDPSPIKDTPSTHGHLLSCADLTHHVLTTGVSPWQTSEMLSYRSTPNNSQCNLEPHHRSPAALPLSTVSSKHGTALAMRALSVSQSRPWSFHLPLHRFVAACLREVCRRPLGGGGRGGLDELMKTMNDENGSISPGPERRSRRETLFRGLMEFPVLVLSRAAQIRAGLWKRNGPGMQDQVLNYAEPPFCRALRDADLTLVQFALLGHEPLTMPTTGDMDELSSSMSEDNGRTKRNHTPSNSGQNNVSCALLINLLLHRFGIFDFAGFAKAPHLDVAHYSDEVSAQLYPGEIPAAIDEIGNAKDIGPDRTTLGSNLVLPWTYSPAKEASASLALLEEFLHLLIVFITELPPPPTTSKSNHAVQAKRRLRREVVHRLASGPKTHSELNEVHHVLPQRDNVVLSEEGKVVNPDDASGAALESALADVAERKSIRGRLAPDQWVLRRGAWGEYDPAFFHISLRCHQSTAENRPTEPSSDDPSKKRREVRPYAPRPAEAHEMFNRIRRDVTADASVLAVAYRTLHVHCRCEPVPPQDTDGLRGKLAYESDAMSETALARAVHLLTLGAFVWEKEEERQSNDQSPLLWRCRGGGSMGSIFHDVPDNTPPTAKDWVDKSLLADPSAITDCVWYEGEDKALTLLQRLSDEGGCEPGGFAVQDASLRSGAAWLCDFATRHSTDAAALIGDRSSAVTSEPAGGGKVAETDMERRKREAKARAMELMKAKAAKFAAMMEEADASGEDSEEEDIENMEDDTKMTEATALPSPPGSIRQGRALHALAEPPPAEGTLSNPAGDVDSSGGSIHAASTTASLSSMSDEGNSSADEGGKQSHQSLDSAVQLEEQLAHKASVRHSVARLLKERPLCIICNEDGGQSGPNMEESDDDLRAAMMADGGEGGKKRCGRKSNGNNNALAFCGYAQASTVLKGGGGSPTKSSPYNPMSAVRKFVGTHVALCGHAVHSGCCESYLATVSQRDGLLDRLEGGTRRGEFRCPLCQRLSNCLVPFIDIGVDWVHGSTTSTAAVSGARENLRGHQKEEPQGMGDNPIAKRKWGGQKTDTEMSIDSDDEWSSDAKPQSLEMGGGETVAHCIEKNTGGNNRTRRRQNLHTFLLSTTWWASRNETSFSWDGRCAFVPIEDVVSKSSSDAGSQRSEEGVISSSSSPSPSRVLRRRVRSFGKKDLYAAWNAVMRTPRFVRRKHPSSSVHTGGGLEGQFHTTRDSSSSSLTRVLHRDPSSSGATDVWRRLMDQLSEVSHRADLKRLGEDELILDYGEFRHYLVERAAFNVENRAAGKEIIDWPTCMSTTTLSESRRQELSREKLISKLLLSIQAFTYSCCSEAAEAKRLLNASADSCDTNALCSKFGISGVACDGELVLMPHPSAIDEGGTQPFEGRLGKLRYFGLAVMVATGAVSREIVQLVMSFPLEGNLSLADADECEADPSHSLRAPISYPLLCGHVLTHVVAAMCATCGQARARSDFLDSASGAEQCSSNSPAHQHFKSAVPSDESPEDVRSIVDMVVDDCEGFVKLGLLARVLQVLLGHMGLVANEQSSLIAEDTIHTISEQTALRAVQGFLEGGAYMQSEERDEEKLWQHACGLLLKAALSPVSNDSGAHSPNVRKRMPMPERSAADLFLDACAIARKAAALFLSDIGLIFQVLVPGKVLDYSQKRGRPTANGSGPAPQMLEKLLFHLGIEPIGDMLQSSLVRTLVAGWYTSARQACASSLGVAQGKGSVPSIEHRLKCNENFKALDWPMESSASFFDECARMYGNAAGSVGPLTPLLPKSSSPATAFVSPEDMACLRRPLSSGDRSASSTPPNYGARKSVPLLGGYRAGVDDVALDIEDRPRISVLPTSYTDLYADLGALCPDSEQTALCLICGEVLNAGGKGECTRHASKCGAGAGLFFLLQECIGLIMHGGKAAYVHSPYVDSHGETPQYRGRPLNLDHDRYNILHELWSGHLIRQKVIAERGSSRQVIIAGFY